MGIFDSNFSKKEKKVTDKKPNEEINNREIKESFSNNPENYLLRMKERARGGDLEAAHTLGLMYYNGDGVRTDHGEAVQWFWNAAVLNHAKSQYHLGMMYETKHAHIPLKPRKAAYLYKNAARSGHKDAQYRLARLYEEGEVVEQDIKRAINLYIKAADQGHMEAQQALVKLHTKGYEIPNYSNNIIKWKVTNKAEQGNRLAQYRLGRMYFFGIHVEKNYQESLKWMSKSAENGEDRASSFISSHWLIFGSVNLLKNVKQSLGRIFF